MAYLPQMTAGGKSRSGGHWIGWFYDETWRCTIHLLWDCDTDDVARYLKRNFGADYASHDEWSGKCIEMEIPNNGAHVICLREWDGSPKCNSVLTHEAFHATEQILSTRGMKLCAETSEPYAYLLESIVRRCLQIIESAKPRKRK